MPIRTCNDCKNPSPEAVWYEGYRLCYPCYAIWSDMDKKGV